MSENAQLSKLAIWLTAFTFMSQSAFTIGSVVGNVALVAVPVEPNNFQQLLLDIYNTYYSPNIWTESTLYTNCKNSF